MELEMSDDEGHTPEEEEQEEEERFAEEKICLLRWMF